MNIYESRGNFTACAPSYATLVKLSEFNETEKSLVQHSGNSELCHWLQILSCYPLARPFFLIIFAIKTIFAINSLPLSI